MVGTLHGAMGGRGQASRKRMCFLSEAHWRRCVQKQDEDTKLDAWEVVDLGEL